MIDLKPLLSHFNLDAIYGVDAETYWASDYSLSDKKRGTTDYIIDDRFELQLMSVRKDSWAKPKVMERDEFIRWARTINWARAGFLAHHAHFDGLIASHHCGVRPAMYFDTLSMARPLMPISVGGSLKAVCAAFGREAKQHSDALTNTKGKRWAEFTKDEKKNLKVYGGEDIDDTWFIFEKLLPYLPLDELALIDLTVKMYAQPSILVDKPAIGQVLINEIARKKALVLGLGLHKSLPPTRVKGELLDDYERTKKHLTSGPKFAEQLKALGITPPTKVSKKKSEAASEKAGYDVEIEGLALSKQDQEFKDLLAHPKKKVRDLVEARFAVSSNILESRCRLLESRAHIGPQPVYLNYYGAKTGRWSGGDNANWQNLSSKRREGGAELRASVHAPPGHSLIIADLAQIEARVNAWFCGQQNVVETFRAYDHITGWTVDKHGKPVPIRSGPDVYRVTAANNIYNKHVDLITEDERFLGKACVLALGFQAGWQRFAAMLRIGALGPPIDITDSLAKDIHTAWRQANPFIVANWRATNNKVKSAFIGLSSVQDGVVTYQGVRDPRTKQIKGWMHLPGGMAIRYDDVKIDANGKDYSYIGEYRRNKFKPPTIKRVKLYGGIEVENRTQALARKVITEHMLGVSEELKGKVRIAMSTHDEIVGVVPNRWVNKALGVFKEVMSQPPSWAPDLPVAVDAHISQRYDK